MARIVRSAALHLLLRLVAVPLSLGFDPSMLGRQIKLTPFEPRVESHLSIARARG